MLKYDKNEEEIFKNVHLRVNKKNLGNIKLIAGKRNMLQQDLINELLEIGLNTCEEMKIIKALEKNQLE